MSNWGKIKTRQDQTPPAPQPSRLFDESLTHYSMIRIA
jgi:hypothetical protein